MFLDIDCLREAKVENVERLGRSLGVPLPDAARHDRRAYARALVRAVMQGLRHDAEQTRHRRPRRRH